MHAGRGYSMLRAGVIGGRGPAVAVSPPPPPAPTFPTPVAWFKFDGDTLDSGPNNYGLTTGTPTFPDGKFVQSALGSASRSKSVPITETGDAVAISAWVYVAGSAVAAQTLALGLSPGPYTWGFGVKASAPQGVRLNQAGSPSFTGTYQSIAAATWTHVYIVTDAFESKLYLNGTIAETIVQETSVDTFTSIAISGADNCVRFDDVVVFQNALDAEQLAYLAAGNAFP